MIRPIKPSDELLYQAFIAKLSPEDIRFRFLAPHKDFSHKFIARFTQIDYARAMAFVAPSQDQQELLGVARLAADPDYNRAEFAVVVRSDLKEHGIGWELMRHLIKYAESEGLRALYGSALTSNKNMLRMARDLGFDVAADPDDPGLCKIRLALPNAAEACAKAQPELHVTHVGFVRNVS